MEVKRSRRFRRLAGRSGTRSRGRPARSRLSGSTFRGPDLPAVLPKLQQRVVARVAEIVAQQQRRARYPVCAAATCRSLPRRRLLDDQQRAKRVDGKNEHDPAHPIRDRPSVPDARSASREGLNLPRSCPDDVPCARAGRQTADPRVEAPYSARVATMQHGGLTPRSRIRSIAAAATDRHCKFRKDSARRGARSSRTQG